MRVYDVDELADGRWYIVSKFIDGMSLAERIAQDRPSFREAAEIVATAADALHYAYTHESHFIHRDIKPANILLDRQNRPQIIDFGLALSEEDFGNVDSVQGGTACYMSPEQARREGHRVDNRSDIFGLGVVLYEHLTGDRPFRGITTDVCVNSTVLAAANRNYRVIAAVDGVATIHDHIQQACLQIWQNKFARLAKSEEVGEAFASDR